MADEASQAPRKTYRGNCHCGAYVYEVELPEITSVAACNCSICSKKGYLFVFVGDDDKFSVVKGDGALKGYGFGGGVYTHQFCPKCGTGISVEMASPDGAIKRALNVRAMQGVRTWDLKRESCDGASVGEQYKVPEHKGELPAAEVPNGKLYTGNCHCGALTLALKSEPLDETYDERVIECNCSICERNGDVWVYPAKGRVVLCGDKDAVGHYAFNNGVNAKTFCKTCGINMTNAENPGMTEEKQAQLSEAEQGVVERTKGRQNVNTRVLNDVDISKLNITQLEGSFGKPYENP